MVEALLLELSTRLDVGSLIPSCLEKISFKFFPSFNPLKRFFALSYKLFTLVNAVLHESPNVLILSPAVLTTLYARNASNNPVTALAMASIAPDGRLDTKSAAF